MTARDIVAALLTLIAPILYVIFFETATGAPYQTMAGHSLLLIALPIGFVSVWLLEQRPPSSGQRPTPVWARLLLGGAAGLLLAVALLIVNALGMSHIQEVPAISLGTRGGLGVGANQAVIRLDDGRTVRLWNAFCGIKGSRITVPIARGLLGFDRVVTCALENLRPTEEDAPKRPAK